MSTFLTVSLLLAVPGVLVGLVCLFKFHPPYKGPDLIRRDSDVVWFRWRQMWRTTVYRCREGEYLHVDTGARTHAGDWLTLDAAYTRQQWEENRP